MAESSQQLLEKLLEETQKSTSAVKETVEKRQKRTVELEEILEEVEAVSQIKDSKERDLRMEVLETNLKKVREETDVEEKDIAKAIVGLRAALDEIGIKIEGLEKLSPEEQNLITDAEQVLAEARLNLGKSKQKWLFKDKAVDAANKAIADAEKGIEAAKVEAESRRNMRLNNATMEESIQNFIFQSETVRDLLETSIKSRHKDLTMVQERKKVAFKIQEQATKTMEELDTRLKDKEAELKRVDDDLAHMVNGSEEHVKQSEALSMLKAEIEDVRGKRNTAFIVSQVELNAVKQLELHESSQMKLLYNHYAWNAALKTETEERVVVYKSRLGAMKGFSYQEASKQLTDFGAALDRSTYRKMVEIGHASDKARMEYIESFPKKIEEIAEALKIDAEAAAQIRNREEEAIKYYREEYGVDLRPAFYDFDKPKTETKA